jgi:hypothetical protein
VRAAISNLIALGLLVEVGADRALELGAVDAYWATPPTTACAFDGALRQLRRAPPPDRHRDALQRVIYDYLGGLPHELPVEREIRLGPKERIDVSIRCE